jgi:hypothetical protein
MSGELSHEWVLLVATTVASVEIGRFHDTHGFWSLFSHIDFVLEKIPDGSTLRLLRAQIVSIFESTLSGVWAIHVANLNRMHAIVEIAMIVIGEVCNQSADLFGFGYEHFVCGGGTEIVIYASAPPTPTMDLVSRITSALDLDEHLTIEYRPVVRLGGDTATSYADSIKEDPRSSQHWAGYYWTDPSKKEPSVEPAYSTTTPGPQSLVYDRHVLRRMSHSEFALEMPPSLRNFNWAALERELQTPSPNQFSHEHSPWAGHSFLSNWLTTAITTAAPTEAGEPSEEGRASPVTETETAPNGLEYIRLAESCLYESPAEDESPERFKTIVSDTPPDAMPAATSPKVTMKPSGPTSQAAICHYRVSLHTIPNNDFLGQIDQSVILYIDADEDRRDTIVFKLDDDNRSAGIAISPQFVPGKYELEFDLHLQFPQAGQIQQRWHHDFTLEIGALFTSPELHVHYIDHVTLNQMQAELIRNDDGGYTLISLNYTFTRGGVPRPPAPTSKSGGVPVASGFQEAPPTSVSHWADVAVKSSVSPATTMNKTVIAERELLRRATTQSTSRTLQDQLTTSSPVQFAAIFDILIDHIPDLMMDSFGHYIAEKLALLGNHQQRTLILDALEPAVVTIATSKVGSFSLQAILESVRLDAVLTQRLFDILEPVVKDILITASGHYVFLRILELFRYPATKFLLKASAVHCIAFSTDHYGLRVMKVLVGRSPSPEREALLAALASHTQKLVENQYGNYVVQLILTSSPAEAEVVHCVISQMTGKFAALSKQKFSSNVVECCLRLPSSRIRSRVINELVGAIPHLIRDRFGNYVLQTALDCASPIEAISLGNAIHRHLHLLRDNVRIKWGSILRDRLGSNMPATQPAPPSQGLARRRQV